MHIVHLSAEFSSIVKAGGLGDVLLGLNRELTRLGHQTEAILPKYDFIEAPLFKELDSFPCSENNIEYTNTMWQIKNFPTCVKLLEPHTPDQYFSRNQIYGYKDDIARFLYFTKAALQYLKQKNQKIDVLHLHDWHVSIAALLTKEWMNLPIGKVVLTIHNGQYQGICSGLDLLKIGIDPQTYFTSNKLLNDDPASIDTLSLLKGGICYADKVNTVSISYAKELQTPAPNNFIYKTLQRYSSKFIGIINGIDTTSFNPKIDPQLKTPYHANLLPQDIRKAKEDAKKLVREKCKKSLENAPWIGVITRLAPQKGLDLIATASLTVPKYNGAFFLLGSSLDPLIQQEFDNLQKELIDEPNSVLYFEYDEAFSHKLYAALDFLLVPSIFEPCGLTQLIAMRYGTIPIVRATGGLKDTVFDIEDPTVLEKDKNGFVFQKVSTEDLNQTLQRAISWYQKNPLLVDKFRQKIMKLDYSWEKATQNYLKQLYS